MSLLIRDKQTTRVHAPPTLGCFDKNQRRIDQDAIGSSQTLGKAECGFVTPLIRLHHGVEQETRINDDLFRQSILVEGMPICRQAKLSTALRGSNDALQFAFPQFSCQFYNWKRAEIGLRLEKHLASPLHFSQAFFHGIDLFRSCRALFSNLSCRGSLHDDRLQHTPRH